VDHPSTLPGNIRARKKGLPRSNALAYFESMLVPKETILTG